VTTWGDVRDVFAACGAAAAEGLAAAGGRWDEPALGSWTVGELGAHMVRLAGSPAVYLSAVATSDLPTLVDAGAYFASYLSGGEEGRAAVAQRARDELHGFGGTASVVESFDRALQSSLHAFESLSAPFPAVATPYGLIALDEYLVTRVVELTIHGLDLAHAIDLDWDPPHSGLRITLKALADTAAHGPDGGRGVVGALSGRNWPGTEEAIPILR
jgi:Mycothiol maleylpyruvate isomerase N-terminal domain